MKQKAFTLAEVLIVLGIIGVVAAMTIPVLMSKYRANVAVTRLQKFYSTMQQALAKSEIDNNEPMSDWTFATMYNYDENMTFFETYLKKYLNVLKYKDGDYNPLPIKGVQVYLSDGSAFVLDNFWIAFLPNAQKLENDAMKALNGRDGFIFWLDKKKKIIPAGYGYDRSALLNKYDACNLKVENDIRRSCAALIMLDGWKVADDYPIKF